MIDFDAKEMRTTINALEVSSKRVTESMKQMGSESSEVLTTIKEWVSNGATYAGILNKITENAELFGKHAEVFKKYFIESAIAGKDLEVSTNKLSKNMRDAAIEATKFKEAMSEIGKVAEIYGGVAGNLLVGITKGTTDIIMGFKSLDPAQVISGVLQLGKALDDAGKYIGTMNREIYDTGAALGKMGEYNENLVKTSSQIAINYSMMPEKVQAVMHQVANAGVSLQNISEVTESIVGLSMRWSDLTPEKQLKMMSDYMDNFGMSSVQAHNVIKNLYMDASKLKGSITELNVMKFMEQVSQVALSVRQWGFEFADAEKYVTSIAARLGETPEALKRAGELATGLMGYGMGNVGLQAYLMELSGYKGNIFQMIGAFGYDMAATTKAQRAGIEQFSKDISGKTLEKITDPSELRGVFQLAAQKGYLPELTGPVMKQIMDETRPELAGLGAGERVTKILEDIFKAGAENKDARIELPGNVKRIAESVTTFKDRVIIQLDAVVRNTTPWIGGKSTEAVALTATTDKLLKGDLLSSKDIGGLSKANQEIYGRMINSLKSGDITGGAEMGRLKPFEQEVAAGFFKAKTMAETQISEQRTRLGQLGMAMGSGLEGMSEEEKGLEIRRRSKSAGYAKEAMVLSNLQEQFKVFVTVVQQPPGAVVVPEGP